jgi:hypothetical protein
MISDFLPNHNKLLSMLILDNKMKLIITIVIITLLSFTSSCITKKKPRKKEQKVETIKVEGTSGELTIRGEVWADNWFAFYLGNRLIIEDSVPITTERSFNAEAFIFKADYPININFIIKDFKENDTGLEYIGSSRQQMGDGGFIAQFTDTKTGEIIAVTDTDWKCKVIHEAPLDTSCVNESNPQSGTGPCEYTVQEEPRDWKIYDFDDSDWNNATTHTESAVRPKDGYDQINWHLNSKLIWSENLVTHNTILCRTQIQR